MDSVEPYTKPIRIFEMVLCAVLVGLIAHSGQYIQRPAYTTLMYISYGGLFIATAVDVISQCSGEPIPATPMFIFCLVGCALFLVSGGLATDYILYLKDHQEVSDGIRIEWISIAAISFLNGLLFLVDAIFIYKYE